MSLNAHVAVVPEGVNVSPSDLSKVASALSKQVTQDFGPIWDVDATVDGFATLEDVPVDYWPIMIMQTVDGALGYHDTKDGQPYAVVQFDKDWPLTASHECLEMLADPFGNRLRAGKMLKQAIDLGQPEHRVNYLVEVCDPSESGEFGYQVNGVTVSDFLTPDFYNPTQSSGVRYSFTGAIDGPRKVLPGGYISWQDPVTNKWMQLRYFNGGPTVVDLSSNARFRALMTKTNVRAAIDAVTPRPSYSEGMGIGTCAAFHTWRDASQQAQMARAKSLRAEISQLIKDSSPPAAAKAARGRRKPGTRTRRVAAKRKSR